MQNVYVPVSITPVTGSTGQVSSPRITLLPGRDLNEIFLTVQSLNPNLSTKDTLLKDNPVKDGPYPAGVPIYLNLSRLKIATPGF